MDHTPARILVVDDEPSITEFVSYALQKENYTVDTAGDGEQALTLIEQKPYDLYILDIMPVSYTHLTLPTKLEV